jgi:hypothetical protein
MAVPYAGFVADPLAALRRIADRAGFAVDPGFAERVAAREVYAGADDTWKRHFSNELVRALDEFEALAAA